MFNFFLFFSLTCMQFISLSFFFQSRIINIKVQYRYKFCSFFFFCTFIQFFVFCFISRSLLFNYDFIVQDVPLKCSMEHLFKKKIQIIFFMRSCSLYDFLLFQWYIEKYMIFPHNNNDSGI